MGRIFENSALAGQFFKVYSPCIFASCGCTLATGAVRDNITTSDSFLEVPSQSDKNPRTVPHIATGQNPNCLRREQPVCAGRPVCQHDRESMFRKWSGRRSASLDTNENAPEPSIVRQRRADPTNAILSGNGKEFRSWPTSLPEILYPGSAATFGLLQQEEDDGNLSRKREKRGEGHRMGLACCHEPYLC